MSNIECEECCSLCEHDNVSSNTSNTNYSGVKSTATTGITVSASSFVHNDDNAEHLSFLLEEANETIHSKESIIKILRNQLQILHDNHKKTIEETETVNYKYSTTLNDLNNLKTICTQIETENEKLRDKLETKPKDSTEQVCSICKGITPVGSVANSEKGKCVEQYGSLLNKIASVESKSAAMKVMIAKEENNEQLSSHIDEVDNACFQSLKVQYLQIEKILDEQNEQLDKICRKLSSVTKDNGNVFQPEETIRNSRSFLVNFSENSQTAPSRTSAYSGSKTSMTEALRIGNDMLTMEINDLRDQLFMLKRCIRESSGIFVDELIEEAEQRVIPMEPSDNADIEHLHEENEVLTQENEKLLRCLEEAKSEQKEIVNKHTEVVKLRDQIAEQLVRVQYLEEVEKQYDELKVDNDEVKDLVEKQVTMIEDKESKIEELKEQLQELQIRLGKVKVQTDLKDREITKLERSLESSISTIESCECRIECLYKESKESQNCLQKIQRDNDSLVKRINIASSTVKQYKEELEVKQFESKQQKTQIDNLERTIRNFDQKLTDIEIRHEQELAKSQDLLKSIDIRYQSSKMENEQLQDTSEKLLEMKQINERLVEEIDRLSRELERLQSRNNCVRVNTISEEQLHKLECLCKNLEDKLMNAKDELSQQESDKDTVIQKISRDRSILETQTSELKNDVKLLEADNLILNEKLRNYVNQIEDLSGQVVKLNGEVEAFRMNNTEFDDKTKCNLGKVKRLSIENEELKQIVTEKECEINNLRTSLLAVETIKEELDESGSDSEEMSTSSTSSTSSGPCNAECTIDDSNYENLIVENVLCSQVNEREDTENDTKFDTLLNLATMGQNDSAVDNEQALSEDPVVEKTVSEDVRSHSETTSDNPSVMRSVQSPLLQEKLRGLQGQVTELVEKETEIESLLKELHSQNVQMTQYNQQRLHNEEEIENRLLMIKSKKDELEADISAFQSSMKDRQSSRTLDKGSLNKAVPQCNIPECVTIPHIKKNINLCCQAINERRLSKNSGGGSSIRKCSFDLNEAARSFKNQHPISTTKPGQNQSPIDIVTSTLIKKVVKPLVFSKEYQLTPLRVFAKTAYSLTITTQLEGTRLPKIRAGGLTGSYKFEQYHFHWSKNDNLGSEHTVDGLSYVMELHAVHIKDGLTMAEALNDDDGIAVLGYFFEVGTTEDSTVQALIDCFSSIKSSKEISAEPAEIDAKFPLGDLVFPFSTSFVTYRGSLTTPPYTENVTWFLCPKTIKISADQLEDFRNLDGTVTANNYRDVQFLYQRKIYFAVDEISNEEDDSLSENIFT